MYSSPNMGLGIWNLLADVFDSRQNENNLLIVDTHDHTHNKGVQIPTGGLADGAVTDQKIASMTITGDKIALATITGDRIAYRTITGGANGNIEQATITGWNIAQNTITGGATGNIAGGTITGWNIANDTIEGQNIDPTTNMTVGDLNVTSTLTAGQASIIGGLTAGTITVDNTLTVEGSASVALNLAVSGNVTVLGTTTTHNLAVSGTTTLPSITNGSLTFALDSGDAAFEFDYGSTPILQVYQGTDGNGGATTVLQTHDSSTHIQMQGSALTLGGSSYAAITLMLNGSNQAVPYSTFNSGSGGIGGGVSGYTVTPLDPGVELLSNIPGGFINNPTAPNQSTPTIHLGSSQVHIGHYVTINNQRLLWPVIEVGYFNTSEDPGTLGFFGAHPVQQQGSPGQTYTLANVVSALQNYGLLQ